MMNKKVLITGCTGQDGSYMVDYLLENTNCDIWGMVRRSATSNLKNIEHVLENKRFHLITGDLSDSQSIDNAVRKILPDYFINFGAQSFVGASWEIPEQTFDIDALGVVRCLEAIRKHVPLCRFYNAGSSEELGNVDYSPQDEAHPLKPRSPYGAAKAAARHIVKVYRESYHLFALQGLLYNHESPRRGEEFVTRKITKQVGKISFAIKNNLPIEPLVLGNIYAKRDWSHAKDFVRGVWMMLHQDSLNRFRFPTNVGGLTKEQEHKFTIVPKLKEYLLASGETHTVKEFIEKSFLTAGIKGSWDFINGVKPENEEFLFTTGDSVVTLVKISPEFYRPAEVDLLLGYPQKAAEDLGWKPEITFDELVREMTVNDLI